MTTLLSSSSRPISLIFKIYFPNFNISPLCNLYPCSLLFSKTYLDIIQGTLSISKLLNDKLSSSFKLEFSSFISISYESCLKLILHKNF